MYLDEIECIFAHLAPCWQSIPCIYTCAYMRLYACPNQEANTRPSHSHVQASTRSRMHTSTRNRARRGTILSIGCKGVRNIAGNQMRLHHRQFAFGLHHTRDFFGVHALKRSLIRVHLRQRLTRARKGKGVRTHMSFKTRPAQCIIIA
jgi:hypothetical protein